MKPITLLVAVVVAAVMLTGCLYAHVTVPYGTELNKTELGHKQGEASMRSVLWLFPGAMPGPPLPRKTARFPR
jgi:hypothetical protein